MFAETLRELRFKNHMSQKDLANAVYISPSAISQYENGKCMPSRDTLNHIARYFGVSTDYLLGTSANAELESLLHDEFCNGMKMSALITLCSQIDPSKRPIALAVIEAFTNQKALCSTK